MITVSLTAERSKMKRSNIKNGDVAFLYARLSRDDDFEGDSYSIVNQKKLLTKVAKEKGYAKTENRHSL